MMGHPTSVIVKDHPYSSKIVKLSKSANSKSDKEKTHLIEEA